MPVIKKKIMENLISWKSGRLPYIFFANTTGVLAANGSH
jgi:hypothetical protein